MRRCAGVSVDARRCSSLRDASAWLGGELAREVDEAGVAARELATSASLVDAEQRRELGGAVWTGSLTRYGRGGDVVGGLGDGELDAVAVDDRAAAGGQLESSDLLAWPRRWRGSSP